MNNEFFTIHTNKKFHKIMKRSIYTVVSLLLKKRNQYYIIIHLTFLQKSTEKNLYNKKKYCQKITFALSPQLWVHADRPFRWPLSSAAQIKAPEDVNHAPHSAVDGGLARSSRLYAASRCPPSEWRFYGTDGSYCYRPGRFEKQIDVHTPSMKNQMAPSKIISSAFPLKNYKSQNLLYCVWPGEDQMDTYVYICTYIFTHIHTYMRTVHTYIQIISCVDTFSFLMTLFQALKLLQMFVFVAHSRTDSLQRRDGG